MANRYSDRTRLTGKLIGQLRRLMLDTFDNGAAVENFVREKLGRGAYNSINWSQATAYSCGDVISHCQSHSMVGQLVENLLEVKPGNTELEQLVVYLVESGYLNDSTKAAAETTNPRGIDWMNEYPFDRVKFDAAGLSTLVPQIAECFTSVGQLERFLGDNIKGDLGKQLQQGIDRSQPVASAVERIVNELARIGWLNCFIMAVQTYNNDKFELGMTAVAITLAYRPPQPVQPVQPAQPVKTTPAAPATTKTTAAPAAQPKPPAPKAFKVVRATGKLTPAQKKELVELMLRAFQGHDLDRLALYSLNVQLDHIVGKGPLMRMCEELIRWCEEQEDKLAPLLNGILKERPSRTDIKPLMEKLAEAGVIEIEK